jgi:hypothetical protein
MRTITWSALPRFRVLLLGVLLAVLLGACAQPGRAPDAPAPRPVAALPPLPASFESVPACPTCGNVALVLRKDGGFLLRERVGRSDFSDFGRWTVLPDRTLSLQGGREKRRAGGSLREQYLKSPPGLAGQPALVAIDARFDEEDPAREEVRILRLPAILSATACPAAQ